MAFKVDAEVLTIVAIALSGVVCVCQVFISMSVLNFSDKLRRMQRAVDHLAKVQIVERNNRESMMRLPLTPQTGESITTLRRDPHLAIPEQFVNSDGLSQHSNGTETVYYYVVNRRNNEGFETRESLMRLPMTPQLGESITMLRRDPHPAIPEQFVNSDGLSQHSNGTETVYYYVVNRMNNEGFENSE